MDRADAERRAKDDANRLARGLDPDSLDAEPVAAMARVLYSLFEQAKRDKSIAAPVEFLLAKVDATLQRVSHVKVACKKGCAHCCHAWVSATAPEALFVASLVRRGADPAVAARVHAAHAATKAYGFSVRRLHPHPCPMLNTDACSVYESRPVACRFAASPDVGICVRVFREFSRETVPVPLARLKGRGGYEIATAIALKRASLPHHHYEYNAALMRALSRDDAQEAWLKGEDIFADVRRDPQDVVAHPQVELMYRQAFG